MNPHGAVLFLLLLTQLGEISANGLAAADKNEILALAAAAQVGKTVRYDPSYHRLAYPGGDLPLDRGVCTDVLIRAFRDLGVDLQVLIHEDMRRAFQQYPRLWAQMRPDRNIDHRRVPNLMTLFSRVGKALPVSRDGAVYRPGEIVVWRLHNGVPHIGIVSNQRNADDARPLIIHNIGHGVQIEDRLFDFTIIGHYRFF